MSDMDKLEAAQGKTSTLEELAKELNRFLQNNPEKAKTPVFCINPVFDQVGTEALSSLVEINIENAVWSEQHRQPKKLAYDSDDDDRDSIEVIVIE